MSYKDQHDKLLEDLALAIDTIYINVPLGSVWLQDAQLADVVAIKPSYTKFCLSIYEVKVTRSDFLSDIRTEKWKGYIKHCNRFYFATPAGIVKKEDIPEGAGWICRGEKGWSVLKASPVNNEDIPKETLLSMIFSKPRMSMREKHIERALDIFKGYRKDRARQARMLGKEIAEAYAKRQEYYSETEKAENLIKRVRDAIKEGLGIEDCWLPEYDLKNLVREIKKKAEEMGLNE